MINKLRGAVRKLVLPPLMRFVYGTGLSASRTQAALQYMAFERSFKALRMLGISVRTIIDVGASNGSWSARVMPFFDNVRVLLIEANPVHEAGLRRLCADGRCEYVLAAAGEKVGEIFFNMNEPLSGKAREELLDENDVRVQATSIDHEIASRRLQGPYLVKLDTHGFEVPILNGAKNTLAEAEVVIIEAYAFQLSPECLKFYDMCRYMAERGFEVFDICEPMWREKDNALWQLDIIFLKKSHPVFKDTSYSS